MNCAESYDALAGQGLTLLLRLVGNDPYAGNLEIADWIICEPPNREQVLAALDSGLADSLCARLDAENCVFVVKTSSARERDMLQGLCQTAFWIRYDFAEYYFYRVGHRANLPLDGEYRGGEIFSGSHQFVGVWRREGLEAEYGEIATANLGLLEYLTWMPAERAEPAGEQQAEIAAARAGRRVFGERNAQVVSEVYAEQGWDWRFNWLRGEPELLVSGLWEALDDSFASWLVEHIAETYGYRADGSEIIQDLRFGMEEIRQYTAAITHKRRAHPYREWAEGLEWDGVSRLGDYLQMWFGCRESALTRYVGRYLFVAMAMRAIHPGCQLPYVPVYLFEDESVASDFLTDLFPFTQYNRAWGELYAPGSRDEARLSASGAMLGVMLGPAEIKDWMHTDLRGGRLPDGSFVAGLWAMTSTRSDIVRYSWMLPVEFRYGADVSDKLAQVRDQLHAEGFAIAKAALEDGEHWRLFRMNAAEMDELRRAQRPGATDLELVVARHIWQRASYTGLDTIAAELGIEFNASVGRELGQALRRIGWERRQRRVDGATRHVWQPATRADQFRIV